MYNEAKEKYAALGVDTEQAMARLMKAPVSLHCWQGDTRYLRVPHQAPHRRHPDHRQLPRRARTPEELMADIDMVLKLCPGMKKLNLHANYAIFDDANGGWVDRDKLEPKHFKKWVDFCKERGLGCDFNPTFFSHPKCDPPHPVLPQRGDPPLLDRPRQGLHPHQPVPGRGAGSALRHEHLDRRRLQGHPRRPHGPPDALQGVHR